MRLYEPEVNTSTAFGMGYIEILRNTSAQNMRPMQDKPETLIKRSRYIHGAIRGNFVVVRPDLASCLSHKVSFRLKVPDDFLEVGLPWVRGKEVTWCTICKSSHTPCNEPLVPSFLWT